MSRRIRRLSMLPTFAGLLVGLSAVACSDKRDDTNTASEISTTTPADGTADTSIATTSQGGTVTASEPAVTTETPVRRSTRRSSSSARVDASADVSANDPYAPDVSRAPARNTPAEINAEARADVNRAEPVDATRNDPALAPSESRADVTARAEVVAPRADVSATAPRADASAPSVDVDRRNDSVNVSVTPPRAEVSSPRVNAEPRRDSASVSVTAPRAEITATTPATTPAPRAEITATTPATTPAPRAEITATTPATTPAPRAEITATTPATTPAPRAEITATTRATMPAPSASATTTPSASANPDAPLVPVGPAAKGWMNDPQLINVLLLANTGDSARAMEVLAPNGDVAAAEKDKDVTTTTASLGGTVAAPRTRIVRKDTTDIWPPRNMHDDPRPRTRTIEVEVPVEEPRAAVSASAAVNPVTPGVSIAVDPSTGAAVISMAAVRAFAEQMARDHTATNARLAELVVEDNVAPAESEKSIEVFNNNRAAATSRRPVTDDASARAWLEREVRAHEQALDNIDRQMLPLAADAELRVILEETKRTIQSHLTQARQLLGTAGSVTPTPAPKAGLDSSTPMPGMRHPAMTDSMRIRTDSMRTRTDSMPAARPMPADSARPRPESTPAQPTQPYPY